MRTLTLVFSALFAATCIAAVDQTVHVSDDVIFVVPADSPVRFKRIGEFGVVTYSGKFQLSGDYIYGYVTDNPEDDATFGDFVLTFRVTEDQAKRLPYWDRDRPIVDIDIRNPDKFARAIIDQASLARLRARSINQVSGRATISVKDLQTSVECDHQYTSVEFVSKRQLQDQRVASTLVDEPGC